MNEGNNRSKAKVPVSVIIPTRNEAGNLRRCLDSVTWADEVFVVDSASTDGTPAIADEACSISVFK